MLKALAWLTDHPPIAAVAIALAAGGVGFVSAWHLKKCPEAVHLQEEEHKAKDVAVAAQQHKDEAPTRQVDRRFAPACKGEPPVVVREVVTERGRVVTDTATAKAEHQVEERKLELTVTPAPRPGWQLQVGLEDVLHAQALRVAARRRLFGPFWAELSAVPATRSVGAGLAVEF